MALELLLERRDLERRVLPDGAKLTLKEKQIFLRDLAYWLELNNYSDVEEVAAVNRIKRKLPSMQRIRNEDAQTIFNYLLERSGILRMPTLGRIDFVHRTFQEYLAAEEVIEQANIGMLIENAEHDHWREVVILAAGHASLGQRQLLLNGLLQRGESEEGQRHRLHLLACACLETSPEVPPELSTKLQNALSSLLPPKNMTEAQAVASAGPLAVPLLRGFQNERVRVTAACVRALALAGGEDALSVLESYGNDRRMTVWDELIRTWSALYFDPAEFSSRVLAKQRTYSYLRVDNTFLIPSIRTLSNIRTIRLSAHPEQGDLNILAELEGLARLTIEEGEKISDLAPLARLKHLEQLFIGGARSIEDLSPLAALTTLREVSLQSSGVRDLSPISNLTKLKALNVGNTKIGDLTPIENCIELEELIIHHTQVSDVSQLTNFSKLRRLDLMKCQVVDLTPLAGATQLEVLDIDGNDVSDLTVLSHLAKLGRLDIANCPVVDLGPLGQLRELRSLTLNYTPGIFRTIPKPLFESLRHLTVYTNSITDASARKEWDSIASSNIEVHIFELLEMDELEGPMIVSLVP